MYIRCVGGGVVVVRFPPETRVGWVGPWVFPLGVGLDYVWVGGCVFPFVVGRVFDGGREG